MANYILGKKQNESNDNFVKVFNDIDLYVSEKELGVLIATTIEEMQKRTWYERCGVAWSGGKDSLVLYDLCKKVSIFRGVIALCQPELEYPEMEEWIRLHKSIDIEIYRTKQDLDWLVKNPSYLFPQHSSLMGRWWAPRQWAVQKKYFFDKELDKIILGRRIQDGNQCGDVDVGEYTNSAGVTIYNPIRHWRHEDILAYCRYKNLIMPPFYTYPNGFIVGTGPWGKRRDVNFDDEGWELLDKIDPKIVLTAATKIESAKAWLLRKSGRL